MELYRSDIYATPNELTTRDSMNGKNCAGLFFFAAEKNVAMEYLTLNKIQLKLNRVQEHSFTTVEVSADCKILDLTGNCRRQGKYSFFSTTSSFEEGLFSAKNSGFEWAVLFSLAPELKETFIYAANSLKRGQELFNSLELNKNGGIKKNYKNEKILEKLDDLNFPPISQYLTDYKNGVEVKNILTKIYDGIRFNETNGDVTFCFFSAEKLKIKNKKLF